jgi:hypothetical protein
MFAKKYERWFSRIQKQGEQAPTTSSNAPGQKTKPQMSALDFYERNRKFLEAREQKLEKKREETRQKEELELSQHLQRPQTPSKYQSGERIEDRLLNYKKKQDKKIEEQKVANSQTESYNSSMRARGRFKSSSNLKNELL